MPARHINAETFQQLIAGEETVLVDFWAPWCPDCVRIADAYDQIADEYDGKMPVVKVNIDEEGDLAREQQVKAIPSLVIYKNGVAVDRIVEPESKALINAFIGETLKAEKKPLDDTVHDMIIIGGGPAGYTAALYAARAGLDTVVLEKISAGGQMALTHDIDNYPGFEDGIDGFTLGQKMKKQAERFGAVSKLTEVFSVSLAGDIKVINTDLGAFFGKTLVIATGANPKQLGVSGESEWIGRGVHYCAACDGMFYKDKTVVVVGGGNSAAEDALLLSRIAKKVILIHRRDTLRATKVYHDPLMKAENVEFAWNSAVSQLVCDEKLTGVKVADVETKEERIIPCDGVFVSIGRKPAAGLFLGQLDMTPDRYIIADETTRTSVPGVYAVGDVRTKMLRQVVTAVSDGAVAVTCAEEYLATH
ncbi:MAG: thioredoxin-disulfide reductase [Clostridiales bacterium]|nr:thioredoxin-disulfide reductase [Clostridiales bacterium]